jgi:hypothetical protein
MQFDEFHITGPGSTHFYYTEHLQPLAVSNQSGGKSRPWNDPDWTIANKIVAWIFRPQDHEFALDWLNTYVRERPGQERTEAQHKKAAEAHQNNLWNLYKNLVRAYGTENPPDFQEWAQQIEAEFTGTQTEFWQVVASQAELSSRFYVQTAPAMSAEQAGGRDRQLLWIKGEDLQPS